MLNYSNVEAQINEQLPKLEELTTEQLTALLSALGLVQSFYQIKSTEALNIFNYVQDRIGKLEEAKQKESEITEVKDV